MPGSGEQPNSHSQQSIPPSETPDSTSSRQGQPSASTSSNSTARPSFTDQHRPPPIRTANLGITTAHERPTSPISIDTLSDSDTGGLHRRSSSRRRSTDGDDYIGDLMQRDRRGSENSQNGDDEAMQRKGKGKEKDRSQQGWAQVMGSPTKSPTKRVPRRRASTVALADGSFVRQLPPTPSSSSRQDSIPQMSPTIPSFPYPTYSADDPFSTPTFQSSFNPVTFDSNYRPSLSRTHSHPLSFDGSSMAAASSSDEDEESRNLTPRARTRRFDNLERRESEDHEFRSPLRPTDSTPDRQRPRLSLKTPRMTPNLGGLSPSRASAQRLSPILTSNGDLRNAGHRADDEGGWQELSPTKASAQSPGLSRRQTLTAAIGGFRRASVRVVNIAGVHSEPIENEGRRPPINRSPSLRRRSQTTIQSFRTETPQLEVVKPAEDIDEDEEAVEKEAEWEQEHQQNDKSFRRLRGKTLYIFGPESHFRRACARVLTAQYVSTASYWQKRHKLIFSHVAQMDRTNHSCTDHLLGRPSNDSILLQRLRIPSTDIRVLPLLGGLRTLLRLHLFLARNHRSNHRYWSRLQPSSTSSSSPSRFQELRKLCQAYSVTC